MSIELVMPSNHLILCHPIFLLPSIFPSISFFSMSQFLASGGQSIGASASASAADLPVNIQDWFPLGFTGWISLQSKSLFQHHSSKASILRHSAFFIDQLSHTYLTTGKTIALTRWTTVGKVMSLLFNMLFRLVIAFLPRSTYILIMVAVTICSDFGAQKSKVCHCFPIYLLEVMGSDAIILVFWMLSFKLGFSLSSFTFIKRLFSSSLSAIRVASYAYLRLLIFLLAILIPACASSSPAFLKMYSVHKLNT